MKNVNWVHRGNPSLSEDRVYLSASIIDIEDNEMRGGDEGGDMVSKEMQEKIDLLAIDKDRGKKRKTKKHSFTDIQRKRNKEKRMIWMIIRADY